MQKDKTRQKSNSNFLSDFGKLYQTFSPEELDRMLKETGEHIKLVEKLYPKSLGYSIPDQKE